MIHAEKTRRVPCNAVNITLPFLTPPRRCASPSNEAVFFDGFIYKFGQPDDVCPRK